MSCPTLRRATPPPRRPGTVVRAFLFSVSLCLCGLSFVGEAEAGEFELALYAGKVVPFYDQTFTYDPGPLPVSVPGLSVEQRGTFHLEGSGALALSGGATWFFSGPAGLEARIDTADVSVPVTGARYRVRIDLPPPLPTLSQDVDLGGGEVDLERLRPLSLNLRVRTTGRPRVSASGGVSYLPAFRFLAVQRVAVPDLDPRGRDLELVRVRLGAEAAPEAEGEGRLGVNAGAALHFPVARRVSLGVEARYFHFQKATLRWGRAATDLPLPGLQELLVQRIEEVLEPVRFNPTFFHAAAGLSISF
jgi:hypothetical protein